MGGLAVAGAVRVEMDTDENLDVEKFDVSAPSPFEDYAAASLETACPPVIHRSTCPPDQFKGIVLFYHGYSSCSMQAAAIAPEVNEKCMDVIAPTHPGHGDHIVDGCAAQGTCDVAHENKGWTHSRLPKHRSEYEAYADAVGAVALGELAFRQQQSGNTTAELYVSGLSFGSPLALYTVMNHNKVYKRMLLMSPYFALGDEDIDEKSDECETLVEQGLKTAKQCANEMITLRLTPMGFTDPESPVVKLLFGSNEESVIKNFFKIMAQLSDKFGLSDYKTSPKYGAMFDLQRTWAYNCGGVFARNKGGFCAFKNVHYLASHSFAMHVVVNSQAFGEWGWYGTPETQWIMTERDGMSRNGLTWQVARHLHNVEDQAGEVDACMYRFQSGVDRSNAAVYWSDANSLPHAFLQPRGNWWDSIYTKIGEYLASEVEDIADTTMPLWNGDRNQCVTMPLGKAAMTTYPALDDMFFEGIAPTAQIDLWWNPILR